MLGSCSRSRPSQARRSPMSWPDLKGFTMLNSGCDGRAVWVHLPCLREALFGFFLDEEMEEVGGELSQDPHGLRRRSRARVAGHPLCRMAALPRVAAEPEGARGSAGTGLAPGCGRPRASRLPKIDRPFHATSCGGTRVSARARDARLPESGIGLTARTAVLGSPRVKKGGGQPQPHGRRWRESISKAPSACRNWDRRGAILRLGPPPVRGPRLDTESVRGACGPRPYRDRPSRACNLRRA